MKKEHFERLVEAAMREIPETFQKRLQNLTVIVEDRPGPDVYRRTGTPEHHLIFGLYHGVPYEHRGPWYGNVPPDVISIYREPIESVCRNEAEIKARIADVLIHEIGHYFGFDDAYLHRIERERHRRSQIKSKTKIDSSD